MILLCVSTDIQTIFGNFGKLQVGEIERKLEKQREIKGKEGIYGFPNFVEIDEHHSASMNSYYLDSGEK